MDAKPGRCERFARCLDAVAAWVRRQGELDPEMRVFEEGRDALLASDVLAKTSQAFFLYCGGDVLDCLEDAEAAAQKLGTKEAPDAE